MRDADRAFAESALAIGQIKLPHANERFVVTQSAYPIQFRHESLAPGTQGARVGITEIRLSDQCEITDARLGGQHGAERRDETAGKYVAFDEIDRLARSRVAVVLDRDGLNQGLTFRGQQSTHF